MKDWSEVELVLAVHRESPLGLAWLVSIDGDKDRNGEWLPKSLTELSEVLGFFERMDERCQRLRVPQHRVSMPRWLALEKGLIAEEAA